MNKRKKKFLIAILTAGIVCTSIVPTLALQIDKKYTKNNRSYQYLSPMGIVLHSTANKGSTADENASYFNRVQVNANAHYFVDWNKVVATVPENEVAWHAGPSANNRYIGIEMCEPAGYNVAEFNQVYSNTIELVASLCAKYGWDASDIVSHKNCSEIYGETDHEDPVGFLNEYGVTWGKMITDIQYAINGQTSSSTMEKAKKYVGNRCLELQQKLNKFGYNLAEDGVYGVQTHKALGDFQRSQGLTVDYIVGDKTWEALSR